MATENQTKRQVSTLNHSVATSSFGEARGESSKTQGEQKRVSAVLHHRRTQQKEKIERDG